MKKLMNRLMLSCKKAVELIEKRSLFGLSSKEKVQLMMHTSACKACSTYGKQSKTIDKALLHHLETDSTIKEKNENLSKKVISVIEEKYF